jgi:hypothetical protein
MRFVGSSHFQWLIAIENAGNSFDPETPVHGMFPLWNLLGWNPFRSFANKNE